MGRRVCAKNWNALRAVGESANRRLCDAEAADAQPAPDVATCDPVTRPSTSHDGLYTSGLRFGDPRVVAVLTTIVGFCYLTDSFTNAQLTAGVRGLRSVPYTSRQATYDLRRLKRKGLLHKLQGAHRYQLTGLGRRVAVLFTKAYGRVLTPGLSVLDPKLPEQIAARSPLATAWRRRERTLNDFIEGGMIAA